MSTFHLHGFVGGSESALSEVKNKKFSNFWFFESVCIFGKIGVEHTSTFELVNYFQINYETQFSILLTALFLWLTYSFKYIRLWLFYLN